MWFFKFIRVNTPTFFVYKKSWGFWTVHRYLCIYGMYGSTWSGSPPLVGRSH